MLLRSVRQEKRMTDVPVSLLDFVEGLPECAARQVLLPRRLAQPGDDFPWLARDYDAIRLAMLEELAARFPGRQRWTTADLEVVIVEVLAQALDQLHDMLDRVTAEATLEQARQPSSLRRLLASIGYDAAQRAGCSASALEQHWADHPQAMEDARIAGPLAVGEQRRMVTLDDYRQRLGEHPLVLRAGVRSLWRGSWPVMEITVLLPWAGWSLDTPLRFPSVGSPPATAGEVDGPLKQGIDAFHQARGLLPIDWKASPLPSCRALLQGYIEQWRMVGQAVVLRGAKEASIDLTLQIEVAPRYYRSEVRQAVEAALARRAGGFFERGRLGLGDDLHIGDLYQRLMALSGIESVRVLTFKRTGDEHPDCSRSGVIPLMGDEVAACGSLLLSLDGGIPG